MAGTGTRPTSRPNDEKSVRGSKTHGTGYCSDFSCGVCVQGCCQALRYILSCSCLCCFWRRTEDGGSIPIDNSKRDQLNYLLDRVFAKRWTLALMMVIVGLIQVVIGGVAYSFVWRYSDRYDERGEENVAPVLEGMWYAWTFMADPGTHSDAFRPEQRIIGSVITLLGILFFASVLGMTVDVIREKMDSLRKGKSKIIEEDHLLILGWTQKTFHIIEELVNANESAGGGVVAVLSPESKERMESELKLQLPEKARRGTRIVIRSGSPLVMGDLVRVSAHMAKAIIILATSVEADEADANTLRALLSLNTLYSQSIRGFIVAEARDIDNEALVKLVGNQGVETVVSHDMIGRLMLMSVRQPGLAKVYEALLGFDGDEFYMKDWPELVGLQFGDLQFRFPDAVPIGVFAANGNVYLKPEATHVIQEGDEIIVIAEDDDTYRPEDPVETMGVDPPAEKRIEQEAEKILICGWRRDVRDILKQLDKIARVGTEVHMLTHCVQVKDRNARLLEDGLDVSELRNIRLVQHYGNTSVRRHLDALPMETYTSCMIFADQMFETDTMYADSHSLATLLLVRDIQANRRTRDGLVDLDDHLVDQGMQTSAIGRLAGNLASRHALIKCPVVCEILDPHTQKTIAGNKHLSILSDFCQTNRLTAQVMAMVAEERAVKLLLDELLGSVGSNIAVVHSSRYVHLDERISFYEVSRRASTFGELVFGYQRRNSIDKTVLNPRRKENTLIWNDYDFAILQGNLDTSERQAFAEVRASALGGDTQWYEQTVERLQVAARTFVTSLQEAADPKVSCEAALSELSHEDRLKVRRSVNVLQDALYESQSGLPPRERSLHSNVEFMGQASQDEAVAQPVYASCANDGTGSKGCEQLPPSVPRATSSSPATLPRGSSSGSRSGDGGRLGPRKVPSADRGSAEVEQSASSWSCAPASTCGGGTKS